MTEKARLKIAALVTALFVGATVSAATLTHPHPAAATGSRSVQSAAPAQPGSGTSHQSTTEYESYD